MLLSLTASPALELLQLQLQVLVRKLLLRRECYAGCMQGCCRLGATSSSGSWMSSCNCRCCRRQGNREGRQLQASLGGVGHVCITHWNSPRYRRSMTRSREARATAALAAAAAATVDSVNRGEAGKRPVPTLVRHYGLWSQ